MEAYRHDIILASIVVYMLACIGVGIWALRRTRSAGDFFMAGRGLGVLVTAFAMFSSTMSGFGFVGGPGLVYRMGTSSFWIVVCSSLGGCVCFFLIGKRLRTVAELRDTVSLPDAIAARYGSEACRLVSALVIILGVIGYLGAQILAMGTVLSELVTAHPAFGDLSLEAALAISCAVLVFYCVTGGVLASVYTDVLQGGFMIVAAVLVFATASSAVDGGFEGAARVIRADDPEAMGPWGTLGVLGCLSWYFVFTFGYAGQPHVITKLMMTNDVERARWTAPLGVIAFTLSALLWIGIGIVMRALVLQGVHEPLAHPDRAAPEFLAQYAHPLLAGIVFAGLFAAIMSTADGFLNIGAAACVHDIPRALVGRPPRRELLWARIATVILAVVAALFALHSGDLVALLGAFGWGTFAAALVPTVAIGFVWKSATPLAAIAAMVTGTAINFGVKLSGTVIPWGIDVGAVALLVSLLVFCGLSLHGPRSRKPIAPDLDEVLDL